MACMAQAGFIWARTSLAVKERVVDRHQRCQYHSRPVCGVWFACFCTMLADRQAAFAKQCAEASSICGDWRKISA